MVAPGIRLLMAAAEVGNLEGALPAAILAQSPASYFTLRGAQADAIVDHGSVGATLTPTSITFNSESGSDGYSYPVAATNPKLEGPDNDLYSPQSNSGLTVIVLSQTKSGAGVGHMVAKVDGSGAGEWTVNNADVSGNQYIEASTLDGTTTKARRTRYESSVAIGSWSVSIARFPASATGYPVIRVNGSTGGTNDQTGTSSSNTAQTLKIFGRGGATGPHPSGEPLAHVAIIPGYISDSACETIEAAAQTDGWY